MRFLLSLLIASAAPIFAGEYAVLATGSRIHVASHESAGSKVRLYLGSGSIEMDSAAIAEFEADDAPPPPAPRAVPAPGPSVAAVLSPQQMADNAANKYGLPPKLVRSVMKAESGFAVDAVSPKGAQGLMQLMPGTAQTLGVDARDPAQNVDAGARYLRELLEKYNGGLRHALAAYNAGPGVVDRYRGVPPFSETINYVNRIEREWKSTEQR